MAIVHRLVVNNVRCIVGAQLDCAPLVNIIYGANGSGKTSVLESLYLLATGKSFRANSHSRSLIRDGQEHCTVFGRLSIERTDRFAPGLIDMGVQRAQDGERRFKVHGKQEASVSAALEALPLAVINSDSFSLVNGSPVDRRRFLDWGVFHVEQRFLGSWQRFQRALKQRNSLLRHGRISSPEMEAWESELAAASVEVDQMRRDYMEQLACEYGVVQQAVWPAGEAVLVRYRRGWDEKADYLPLLKEHRERDAARGFTSQGAHRADISFRCAAGPAGEILSRGQQKLLACCLKLAQGEVLRKRKGRRCVYLIDDLPAELDRENRAAVVGFVRETGCQGFFSTIEPTELHAALVAADVAAGNVKMFHVEHGRLAETSLLRSAR